MLIESLTKPILVFFLLFVPGYVTFASFVGKGKRSRGEGLEIIFGWVLVSILIISLGALILAELGRFSLGGILLLVTGYVAVLIFIGRPSLVPSAKWKALRCDRSQVLPLGLLLVTAILFFHPFENIFVGRDAGVYINTGVNIAKTGSILIRDEFFAGLSEEIQADFLHVFLGTQESRVKFRLPGFYWVAGEGKIVPQFLHLYPIWIAIFYALFGLQGSLFATPFIAWLGVVALYLVGKTLFDRRVGLIALALMTVNASQIWFARYANADILFQLLFLGGVLYWALFVRHGHPLWGVISGACFGEALLAKVDAQYLLIPLALIFGYLLLLGLGKKVWYFLAPLGTLGVLTGLHILVYAWPYYRMSWGFVSWSPASRALMLSLVPLLALALLAFGLRGTSFMKAIIAFFRAGQRYLSLALAVGIVVLGFYMYFVLPHQSSPVHEIRGTTVKLYTKENFVRLGWYLTPLGLFLAVIGLAQAIRIKADVETAPLLLSALTYSALNLPMSLAIPDHIFAIRRYISVVIPSALLFASYALCYLLKRKDGLARAKQICFATLTILILIGCLHRSAIIIPHREFAGAIVQVDRIADELPPRSVAIFENQSLLGYFLAPPLTFIHGREAVFAWVSELSPESFAAVVEAGLDEGREVFFFSEHGRQILLPQYDLISQWAATLDVPALERAFDHFPSRIDRFQLPYRIYQVQPGSGTAIFRADSLPKQVGRDVTDDEALWGVARQASVALDREGFLSYGPYAVFPPGSYIAHFCVKAEGNSASRASWAIIDAAAAEGSAVLASRRLSRQDFTIMGKYQDLELEFHNPARQALEFRVYFTDQADLWVDRIEISPIRGRASQ